MTIQQTIQLLSQAGKRLGETQLRKYFVKLKIEPLGARQRPQQYPDDAAEKILRHLGFAVSTSTQRAPAASYPPKRNGNGISFSVPDKKILTIKQLKKVRKK